MDLTPAGIRNIGLAVEIGATLQKKVLDSAEQTMASLLRTMPQSASLPGVGSRIDISG